MQRSYVLRWLALAIGVLATQCLDSISDDCEKTLTCEDNDVPTLWPDCTWRYRGGREWTGAPKYDSTTNKWRWPDGKETDTQTFKCNLPDAGADAGSLGGDCRLGTPCDEPRVCLGTTGTCVECIDDSQCANNVPVGDAGAGVVCDQTTNECVPCLRNEHCTATGNTLICKVNQNDSRRNECVQCEADEDCSRNSPSTPVCDETSNDCTTTCTSSVECGGDKRVCNTEKQVCVECLAASDCQGANAQCNTVSNKCVECIDDAPCAAAGEVCDTERNLCVQCRSDVECANNTNGNAHCDTEAGLCVQCLDDLQCSAAASSRCNLANHTCVGCTADTQCEMGLHCNTTLGGGTCVECLEPTDCAMYPGRDKCETVNGRCVQCLTTLQCPGAELAHCQTQAAGDSPQYTCVPCIESADCVGKGIPELCDTVSGDCVNCITNAECSPNAAASLCRSGDCTICSLDDDCALIPGLGACLPGTGCVECVTNSHCVGNDDGAVCKTSNAGAAAGPAAVNTCVECQSNADCTSPTASVCVNNACQACSADTGCSHVRGAGNAVLGVCDAGTCVQCTGPKRALCGEFVCDSLARACSTSARPNSAALCDTCVSDQQCAATARCVQQTFGGTTIGAFCVPVPVGNPASCNTLRPYFGVATLSTLDNQQPTAVCTLRETTCPALDDQTDECEQDSDCGASGVADGLCVAVGGGEQCTTPCVSANDCTGNADCLASGCEL